MQKHPLMRPLLRNILFIALSLLLAASTPNLCPPAAQERGQGVKRPAEAKPEQRLALVIGNAAYKESPLANPANDARDMAATLRGVGFEVLSGEDRNQRQMKELIRQFGQKLRAGGVGVFYFAGHGVQVAGRNYLIPIGAEINAESEVEYEAVELGFVLAQLEEARNRLNVVILDACRNNPYARSFSRGRSDSRGLAGIRSAPSGTLISYATAADDVANDGGARNGLFTGELLTQLKTPGLTLEQVFRRTRTSVRGKSSGKQVPYEYSSVEGEDFYFIPPNAPPPVISAEQQAWERVKQRHTPDAVRGFLIVYPDSPFEKEARALLAVLEKEKPPATTPVSTSAKGTRPRPTPPKTTLPPTPAPLGEDGKPLTAFHFSTASVDAKGKIKTRSQSLTWGFTEELGDGVTLEMIRIPAGSFTMGAPKSEAQSIDNERPQHLVNVAGFYMGRFEVTREQWRAVARVPKVKIELKEDPAYFKGSWLQPVDSVSWEEAVEFCARLKQKIGKEYRLPSEAQWEYAARAGTTTAFAFGETISPEIVNYQGKLPYGPASKGIERKKTVPVGSLGVANAFGLFDMHGNVWEWCQDTWHGNYDSTPYYIVPNDGSAWESGDAQDHRVLRGGAWVFPGTYSRSAYRYDVAAGARHPSLYGFRIVMPSKTQ
ncbi:MAG: SUMF1/EgtB/PvdO family nonheme iron enzyme [Acidobacteriota bacterium]